MRGILTLLLLVVSSGAWACLSAPLPTEPSGPTWQVELDGSTYSTDRVAELTMWRQPCEGEKAMLLATFEPIEGAPFICPVSQIQVIQGGQQYSNFRLRPDPDNPYDSFCNDLLVKSTFKVGLRSTQAQWDTDAAFTLVWEKDTTLDVGPFNPADYGQATGPKPLHGSMSGSWYDPTRSGEGFALDFSQNPSGPIATLYWFTHKDGLPYWLIGTSSYNAGQTEITFDLLEVSGTGFGVDFDPDEIDTEAVGAISLEFDSCNSGMAAWELNEGETGSFNLVRIAGQVHGAPCQ